MGAFIDGGQVGTQRVSAENVRRFSELTGDHNPIHEGDHAIVHGVLILGVISAAVWRMLGDGVIAKGIESLSLERPVHPDEDFNVFVGNPEPIPGSKYGEQRAKIRVYKMCNGREKVIAHGTIIVIVPN